MHIHLERNTNTPLYLQIQQFLRQQIESGVLQPQTRLPASRELASSLGISRMTAINAYAELEAEGLIISRHGSGTFVAPPHEVRPKQNGRFAPTPPWQQQLQQRLIPSISNQYDELIDRHAPPHAINFTAGLGSTKLFDGDAFRKTISSVMRRDAAEGLGYGDANGYKPLRQTIAHILAAQGIPALADDVLITSGSQQGIALVANLLLRPGDSVLVESLSYEGALDIFRAGGIRLVPIPMDENGLRPDRLESLIKKYQPRLIYTMPTFHNPTGTSLTTQRRQQLVSIAYRHGVPILEDDFAGDLRYDGPSLPTLKSLDPGGYVIYINTFSKVLVPGLRIGYLVVSGPVRQLLLQQKLNHDRTTSGLMQRALEAYMTVGKYQVHVRRVCRVYRQRQMAMHNALKRQMPNGVTWQRPNGGLFFWVKLPDGLTAVSLFQHALRHGVIFSPGVSYTTPIDYESPYLRLNFTVLETHTIEQGIQRLAQAIRTQAKANL